MRPLRLTAVFLIYLGVSLAWVILGASVSQRTAASFTKLRAQMAGLWGSPLSQRAPVLTVQETLLVRDSKGKVQERRVSHRVAPDSSEIRVKLHSDSRRKGLLWYRTYAVEFEASYTVSHEFTHQPVLVAEFLFPSDNAIYDDFLFSVNGVETKPGGIAGIGLSTSRPLPPGKTAVINVRYRSRGLDTWTYLFDERVAQVKGFRLVVDTDFRRFDFPDRSLSPTQKRETGDGWELTWQFANLISGFSAGVEMPEETNPGPITARISYLAPVGLLFFLAVLVIMGVMRGQNLHPMHYFFVSAGFFAFHLLMAYLADHLDLRLTFLTCAIVSVALVVTYLVRAIGVDFALRVAAPAQLIYLVLFSYAFFFEGYTGLSITFASILTLAVLMHITAKVDWETRFRKPGAPTPT